MNFRTVTIEKSGETCIRFGEASVIGGVATLFVQNFPVGVSVGGVLGGIALIWVGLLVFDRADRWGEKSREV
ncbi:hypothetical protein L0337_30025 [candidate division KSB1 bacterium]|nr:hypothetical protein [candidate division KSB1 bacterium]